MKQLFLGMAIFVGMHASLFAQHDFRPTDANSKVKFSIKNFGIRTGGEFTGLKGNIHFDPAHLEASKFVVSVDAKTVDTDNDSRDGHLRKEEYFDVAKYPVITITSTRIVATNITNRYYFAGTLTIKGITQPIGFGFTAVPFGNGWQFAGEFEINRRNFKVGGGSLVLQDQLKVQLSVSAIP